jgi:hypothetical protein
LRYMAKSEHRRGIAGRYLVRVWLGGRTDLRIQKSRARRAEGGSYCSRRGNRPAALAPLVSGGANPIDAIAFDIGIERFVGSSPVPVRRPGHR